MRAILILLFFAFAYSIPNPVYTIKDCFEKIYNVNGNPELQQSVNEELLHWKVKEFYEKLDKVEPTLKPRIEDCVYEVNKKFRRPRRRISTPNP